MKIDDKVKAKLKDKRWRLNNLYKIRNKQGELVTFKMNAAQEHFLENAWCRNVILKSRQLGFTTFEAIDILDDTLFTPGFQAVMISYDKRSALEIFDGKITLAWEHFPAPIKKLFNLDADRSNKLKFGFGEGVYSQVSVVIKARSGTNDRVHISEMGKVCAESPRKAREIITGTIPTVPVGKRCDIESTAEGEEGEFHDMWWQAWDRGEPSSPMEFKAHFYNWQWDKDQIERVPVLDVPKKFKEYQQKRELTDKEISYYYQVFLSINSDWDKLMQEYPTTPEEAFNYSGKKLFTQEDLEWQKQFIKDGEKIGDWIYYEKFNPSHLYGLGADVAEGIGQDSSTAVIIDFTNQKTVAEFHSNEIPPDLFAHELIRGANNFGSCIIGVENNNHGYSTLVALKGLDYRGDIYVERKEDRYGNVVSSKMGWTTNLSTKPHMLYQLSDAIREQSLQIPSKVILSELRTYDKRDMAVVRFDPEASKHWDRVMALAIAYQMRLYARKPLPASGGNLLGDNHYMFKR